ncbi:pYEATS domain-containing protein [Tardiphaga sp. 768_D3_N2_1]|uniref:pYEATS domain-containing protein n=1 Tax=Tardiphaga sp. 768_D3_N2_1 TaxID=3240783 RepID=UPI003F8B1671
MTEKPFLSQVADLLSAVSSFAWPVLLAVLIYALKDRLREVVTVAIRRIEQATDIEFGSLKLKGATVTQSGEVLRGDSASIELAPARKADVDKRLDIYSSRRSLMVVHTIKPVEPAEFVDGYRVFGVSVFLRPHRNFGKLNDVKSVTYYLGDKWGEGKFGSKYVIKNGNEQFAMTAQMYGACLCTAEIEFHDGAKIEVDRYLDVEMAPAFGIPLDKARE